MRLRLLLDDGATEVAGMGDVRDYYGKYLLLDDEHSSLSMRVDFDDVDHTEVINEATRLVKIVAAAECEDV